MLHRKKCKIGLKQLVRYLALKLKGGLEKMRRDTPLVCERNVNTSIKKRKNHSDGNGGEISLAFAEN